MTAGIDTALWDLFARKANLPLREYIRSNARDKIPAYASGIQVSAAKDMLPVARQAGFRNFKRKVGFHRENDIIDIRSAFEGLSKSETLAADANQGWALGEALHFLDGAAGLPLQWLEEPIAVYSQPSDWRTLAERSHVPIAGGENIAGFEDYSKTISQGSLGVIQPDVTKWGGVTGSLQVGREAMSAGRRYCPHFLGGGIGLAASAEIVAALGGDGLLEVDANVNPLRTALFDGAEPIHDGLCCCQDAPGLGIAATPEQVFRYQTMSRDLP